MNNEEGGETNNICSICLEEMDVEEGGLVKIDCRCQTDRYFHRNCLTQWIRINPTCPMCSANLRIFEDNQELLVEENIIEDPNVILRRTRINSFIFLIMFIFSLYILLLLNYK